MEKPESLKFTHAEVNYQEKSIHPGERCDNCKHFIPATDTKSAGCEGVKRPIEIAGWCIRYEKDNTEPANHLKVSYRLARNK
jgi:hypothetical protein